MLEEQQEQLNSDVVSEGSSDSQNQAVESQTNAQEAEASESNNNEDASNTPFHKHPRFVELVQQKNAFAEQAKTLESRLAEMQSQFESFKQARQPAPEKPKNPVISRLKEIDPEFGQSFEEVYSLKEEIAQLKQFQEQAQLEKIRTEAFSTINGLHETNKVPKELRDVYQTQIQAMVGANPKLGLKDLPNLYKSVHDQMSVIINGIKAAERNSYVSEKKQGSNIPATSKGVPTPANKKMDLSQDPYEARQQLVKAILKESKANKDL